MSDDFIQILRDTIAKSTAVGGELMRQAVLRVLTEEFALMTDGVDLEARKQIIIERIRELPLP